MLSRSLHAAYLCSLQHTPCKFLCPNLLGLSRVHMEKVQELSQPQAGAQPLHFDDTYAMPFWRQYCTVLKKFLICYWRYPQYNSVRRPKVPCSCGA